MSGVILPLLFQTWKLLEAHEKDETSQFVLFNTWAYVQGSVADDDNELFCRLED